MEQLKQTFQSALFEQTLVKIIFSNPRKKSLPYKKVTLRPILLHGRKMFQAEFHYEKKAIHENLEEGAVLAACLDFVLRDFKQINLFTEESDIQILAAKPDRPKIIQKPRYAPKGEPVS